MRITLTRHTRQPDGSLYQAYPLRVTASGDVTKIFVFKAVKDTAEFISIADPVDLEEYPEDAADIERGTPYFLKDSVELLFRSNDELEGTWAAIQSDVQGLVLAINAATETDATQEVTFE